VLDECDTSRYLTTPFHRSVGVTVNREVNQSPHWSHQTVRSQKTTPNADANPVHQRSQRAAGDGTTRTISTSCGGTVGDSGDFGEREARQLVVLKLRHYFHAHGLG
jgi:hypothetical protein